MTLHIYNTLTRTKEEFVPLEPGKVRMYVCGPTVYADAHVGHAMAAIVFDMVRRYLIYKGYDVHYVTNFTDVDDKIIKRANETGEDPMELANHYANKYLEHLAQLNVMPADEYPRVSREINEIIHVIQGLDEKGYAYAVDGDVYFRVLADEDYGKLSRRKLDEGLTGTRVEEDERKEFVATSRSGNRPNRANPPGRVPGDRGGPAGTSSAPPCASTTWARPSISTAAATISSSPTTRTRSHRARA